MLKAEQEQKRKADRRLAREKRAKDQAKEAFRELIVKDMVEKGSFKEELEKTEV